MKDNMRQKNKISNNITDLIKEFTEKHCSKCKSYVFCGGEMVLSCKEFNKFLEEHDRN
jgi:hypothetical protein